MCCLFNVMYLDGFGVLQLQCCYSSMHLLYCAAGSDELSDKFCSRLDDHLWCDMRFHNMNDNKAVIGRSATWQL